MAFGKGINSGTNDTLSFHAYFITNDQVEGTPHKKVWPSPRRVLVPLRAVSGNFFWQASLPHTNSSRNFYASRLRHPCKETSQRVHSIASRNSSDEALGSISREFR